MRAGWILCPAVKDMIAGMVQILPEKRTSLDDVIEGLVEIGNIAAGCEPVQL